MNKLFTPNVYKVKAEEQVTLYTREVVMKTKKKQKVRNWLAVHAHQRNGGGSHKDKSKYNRKQKHKRNFE